MTIQEAQEKVILAGEELVRTGLIARTWGNISCRISDTEFLITPSGRDYLSLTSDEIVKVSISDLSYDSNVKPSSEKGVHSEVYKQFPNANFVIHTHQNKASAISATDLSSIKVSCEEFPLLGGEVICAEYALPGTKKLMVNVSKALSHSKGKTVIMKHHGALCFGEDYDETFKAAHELESACESFITSKNGGVPFDSAIETLDISERGDSVSEHQKDTAIEKIINEIFRYHNSINFIVHVNSNNINSIQSSTSRLLPLLDDFAQIAGTSVKSVEMNTQKILSALRSSSAVLIKGYGALCVGGTKGDAEAVSMVLEKNCIAYKTSSLVGKIKYINPLESRLMRFVYLKKYSKQFNKE